MAGAELIKYRNKFTRYLICNPLRSVPRLAVSQRVVTQLEKLQHDGGLVQGEESIRYTAESCKTA
jgi:hypothetical protein